MNGYFGFYGLMEMMKMKYGYLDICEISYYNNDNQYWEIVVSKTENHVILIDFNDFGEYNGYLFRGVKDIDGIFHSGKMLEFIRKTIDFSSIPHLALCTKADFIEMAKNNNKVLGIAKKSFPSGEIENIKVLKNEDNILTYKVYSRCGKLYSKIYKVRINDIVLLQIDAKYQRLIERVREE